MRSGWLFLLSFLLTLAVVPAFAGSAGFISGNVANVIDYAPTSSTPASISFNTLVRGPAANDKFVARVVPIVRSDFIAWFRPNMKTLFKLNPWWLAFLAASGWIYDEVKNQLLYRPPQYKPGLKWHEPGVPVYFSIPDAAALSSCGSACNSSTKVYFPNGIPSVPSVVPFYVFLVGNGIKWDSNVESVLCAPGDTSAACKPIPDEIVGDELLFAKVQTQMALDPAYAARALIDPLTGLPYPAFKPVPYIPAVSAPDEALIKCFRSGNLTIGTGACGVANQAEYDRIKDLSAYAATPETPQEQADAANDGLKQAITQAQYEASDRSFGAAIDSVAASAPASDSVSKTQSANDELDNTVKNINSVSLPGLATFDTPGYSQCKTITFEYQKAPFIFPSSSQCEKIEQIKSAFGYFLAGLVLISLVWQLLTRPQG